MSCPDAIQLVKLKRPTEKKSVYVPIDMSRVAAIVLGGGEGTRLFPLTASRCKPAISFGGRFRLIDIPLSNSINSGCLKIYVITQFLSTSLHQHICKTYHPGTYNTGFIELLPAEQKPKNKNWFQGTADAVRQNMEYFCETPADYFLILSGDQLYNINFQEMLRFAKTTDADLVVAALPVNDEDAKRMGLLKVDGKRQITDFYEKPETKDVLNRFRIPTKVIKEIKDDGTDELHYLGSMGIYLFKREVLLKLLQQDSREDFGKHLIPTQVKQGKTFAYLYKGYWEDIGTIESFYNANLALTERDPEFDWYDENNLVFTSHNNLPGPKIYNTQINSSIICEGAVIEAKEITHSILGMRTVVKKGSVIRHSYITGNDSYAPTMPTELSPTHFQIGENCLIERAIIDKHVYIGNDVKLINKNKLMHYNSDDIYIRDGIIIVTRGAILPDGFTI